jgi:hypothetical protein
VVDASAFGSSLALAKKAPPRTIAPTAAAATIGSRLLFFISAGDVSPPSEISNHSGFSEAIARPLSISSNSKEWF